MKLQSDNKLRPYLPVTIQYPKWHNSLHKRNHTWIPKLVSQRQEKLKIQLKVCHMQTW
jgi:hypothetical protein